MVRLFLITVLAAACGGRSAAPATVATCPAAEPTVATADDFHALSKRACECTTDACSAQVAAEVDALVVQVGDLDTFRDAAYPCPSKNPAIGALREIHDHACACKDTACVEVVHTEFEAWAVEYADNQATPAEAEEAGRIAEGISECVLQATAGVSSE